MKYLIPIILLLLNVYTVYSQQYISGKIIDRKTKEPLAFVNIVYNEKGYGMVSNIDGEFQIQRTSNVQYLKFSYVGYHSTWLDLNTVYSSDYHLIRMDKKAYDIDEVTILPGINPAHRIIKLAVENKNENNPEKMQSFAYRSYSKLYFTVQFDTANVTIAPDSTDLSADVPESTDTTSAEVDSSVMDAFEFFEKQHLFLMEFISEREFIHPDKNKETVIASRVSGFKDPSFTLLASQIQSFAFYDNLIMIWDKKYLNPISNGSTRKYLFILEDTMYTEKNDTLFVISYRPLRGKNFDGLRGILHINSNKYAVQNVIAEAAEQKGLFRIRIQQKYDWLDNTQWFPSELNTDIILSSAEMKANGIPVSLIGVGKSYLSDISLNPDLKRKGFNHIELRIEDDAHKKSDEFWNAYRKVPLTARDTNTYHFIDSIGEEANLDRTLMVIETVASGYIPWKFLDIDYRSIIDYNRYEGFRLGIGVKTNQSLSRWFNVGGKFAYGIRDNSIKYGGHLQIFVNPLTETAVKVRYNNDVSESAGIRFIEQIDIKSTEMYRSFLIANMDEIVEKEIMLSSSIIRYLKLEMYLNQSQKYVSTDYTYLIPEEPASINQFEFTEIGLRMRFAYKEKFLETPRGNRLSVGTDYPVIYANILKGVTWLDGRFDYTKYEGKVTKTFISKSLGDTKITIMGGLVDKPVPYTNLYNGHGSYGVFTIETENSFATMRMNEFVLDRFASVFFQQDFGKLLFKTEKFQPGIVLATHAGYGDLHYTGNHENIDLQTMEKGYFESGLLIKNILNQWFIGYGLGVFYRYGPYSFNKTIDNFAFKFTITFNI